MTTQLSIPQNALAAKEAQPFTALCFTTRATLRTLAQYAPGIAENLFHEARRLNLAIAGPIQWIYTGATGDETHEFQLDIVLPIRKSGDEPSAEFSYQEFPSFPCVSHTHAGPWSDFSELYNALFGQLHRDGHQYNGTVHEVYRIVDLDNPANCVTEIQIGLA